MGVLGTFCFDGLNFSQASALYTDSTLSVLATDGYYSQGGIVRRQLNGVLLNAQPCSNCAVACGSGVAASISNQTGKFAATIELGNTTGAVVLYFYMGQSIPDGAIATFNSAEYNRMTCKGNHDTVTLIDGSGVTIDYAGQGNQGTSLPTYVGNQNSSLLSNSPYDGVGVTCSTQGGQLQNYILNAAASPSYVPQGTFLDTTVTVGSIGYASDSGGGNTSPVFTMIVGKDNASATTVVLDIYAPLCGTVFNWEVDCPVALPSFQASSPVSGTTCAAATTTYYFSQDATRSGSAFVRDTNTTPNIGNFVFSDEVGVNYLNDSFTLKYFIVGGNTAIGVRNGVVVSKGPCT